MSTYVILTAGLIAVWLIAFYTNGKEIMSPASVVVGMFLFTAALCIYGYGSWNKIILSFDSICIVLIGCLSFVFGCACVYNTSLGSRITFRRHTEKKEAFPVRIAPWKLAVLFLGLIVIAYIRVRSMHRLAAADKQIFTGIIELSKWYREKYSRLFGSGTVLVGVGETFIEKQILRFATVISNTAVITLLIGIYKKNKKTTWLSVALLLLYTVYNVTNGGRATVLFKLLAIVYGIYVLQLKKGKSIRQINKRFVVIGIILVLIGLPVFYYSSALVGRKSNSNIMEYLSFYVGCGIPSMEMMLDAGIAGHMIGKNVFHGIYTLLYKVRILGELDGFANEWVTLGSYQSNVFTAWYRYYADFGLIGTIVFPFLLGVFFTYLFKKVKETDSLFYWTIFCSWCHVLFDLNRDEYLFGQFLGTAPLINLTLTILFVYLVCLPAGKAIQFNTNVAGEGSPPASKREGYLKRIHHGLRPEKIRFHSAEE